MSFELEDNCVGCPKEMGCLGNSCPYMNVPVFGCDTCDSENAKYNVDGTDYCEECFEKYLIDIFKTECTITEKADLLNVCYLSPAEYYCDRYGD